MATLAITMRLTTILALIPIMTVAVKLIANTADTFLALIIALVRYRIR